MLIALSGKLTPRGPCTPGYSSGLESYEAGIGIRRLYKEMIGDVASGTLRLQRLSSHSGIPDYLTGLLAWIKTSSALPVICMERPHVLGGESCAFVTQWKYFL